MTQSAGRIRRWFRRKVRQPLLSLLKQGTSPRRLAASIACGAVVGVCPLVGASTFVSVFLAALFRLNHPATQLFNYLVYPLQILLVIPFIQLGSFLFRTDTAGITLEELEAVLDQGMVAAMAYLGGSIAHALAAWVLVGVPFFLLATACIAPLLRRWQT